MHRILHAAITPLIVMAASGASRALDVPDAPLLRTDQGLTFRAWVPADFAGRHGDIPLILFSHGFGGCAQQSYSLAKALAAAGYAVLAPNHRDEACERYLGNMAAALGAGGLRPDKPFTQPQAWNDRTEINRRDDMEALLNFARSHAPFKQAIDPNRIAAMGHSLGGYTVLGLASAWGSWRDPGVKCVLALSPYTAPFVAAGTLKDLQVPVMYQTGTRDIGIAPALLRQKGFEQTAGRKYLLVLRGAGHFAWTELNSVYQTTIAQYAVAFFEMELMGRPAALLSEKGSTQVADFWHP